MVAAVGDKVRLAAEGVVTSVDEPTGLVFFRVGDEEFAATQRHLEVVESLQKGDVVLDADGYVYQLSSIAHGQYYWTEPGSADVCQDSEVLRPLTVLVRHGAKV